VERVYFGIDKPSAQEDESELRRAYELSQIDRPAKTFFQVPYTHLVTIVQMAPLYEGVRWILQRNEQLGGMDADWEARLKVKVDSVRAWVKEYAPDEFRFAIQAHLPSVELDPKEKELLARLSTCLSETEWTAEKLHSTIHETGKALGLEAAQTFGALYKVILGKQRGPRMGYFLQSMDRAWVLKRLKEGSGS